MLGQKQALFESILFNNLIYHFRNRNRLHQFISYCNRLHIGDFLSKRLHFQKLCEIFNNPACNRLHSTYVRFLMKSFTYHQL